MSDVMQVLITTTPAATQWGSNALLSFSDNEIRVHVTATNDDTNLAVQRAARQLDGMGITGLACSGDNWDLESRWHLWDGFYNPKRNNSIDWGEIDTAQAAELAARRQASLWVREMTNGTPEHVYPRALAESAAEILKQQASTVVSYRIVEDEALQREGYQGIYQVGRGGARKPVMLQLDYNPSGSADAPVDICLVGKGITFDSGGYSIKGSSNMVNMKADMGGAAMVTGGLMLAIARGLNKRVKLYLCCAENLISGDAFKLGDVICYKNGVTAEVLNTDAEGRLVLADGLIAASEQNPRLILDAATLTGAAKVALGRDYNAVFSFEDETAQRLIEAAQAEHEKAWRLPLEKFHLQQTPSAFADIANVGIEGSPGASTAAAFLAHFVRDQGRGWVHMDLSGSYLPAPNECWAKGAKGHGLRTIARFLQQA